jgi:colanic acid biosynthesis glycosyl transferase WcaI
MRLLLVNQYFWPDRAATAQLLGDLACTAAAEGFEVTALSGRGSYAAPDRVRLESREEWNGVEIHRLPCTSFGRGNIAGRISDYLTYLISAIVWILFHQRFDTVVCLSTPPLVALVGVVARRQGSRFIYKVEDLYPDIAVELGALSTDSVLARALTKASSSILSSADVCVALDDAMGSALRKRGAGEVAVIPNWADGEAIKPDIATGDAFREKHRLGGGLTVLYSGNLGNAHRFEEVCDAIQLLDSRGSGVRFLFVGAGPRLGEVKQRIEGLESVRFLPYQSREELGGLYNAADIHLVTLRDEVAGKLVPSKYSAALAAGKPVLLVGGYGADLHTEVDQEDVGWVCPHQVEAVVEAIHDATEHPDIVAGKGRRARALFDRKYSQQTAMKAWLDLLRPGEQEPS